jgi:hypothetical protein
LKDGAGTTLHHVQRSLKKCGTNESNHEQSTNYPGTLEHIISKIIFRETLKTRFFLVWKECQQAIIFMDVVEY